MADECERHGVEIWAWCLMPNHSHMIAVPPSAEALRRAIGEAHRRYTTEINRRHGWRGCLWQGRFAAFVMDPAHTLMAARYIEMNPVRAHIVARPEEYLWSSACAHLQGRDDALCRVAPLLERVGDWASFLGQLATDEAVAEIRKHQSTGRPLGSDAFIDELERQLGRSLRPRKPGPAPKAANDDHEPLIAVA